MIVRCNGVNRANAVQLFVPSFLPTSFGADLEAVKQRFSVVRAVWTRTLVNKG